MSLLRGWPINVTSSFLCNSPSINLYQEFEIELPESYAMF